MRLYRVDIQRTMFVAAEDRDDALACAREFEHDHVGECEPEAIDAREVMHEAQIVSVSPDWMRSLPWGEDDDRTCEWYVHNRAPEPFIDTQTGDMFTGDGDRA